MNRRILEEYRKWMLGQGFSLSTIRHAITFPEYLERKGLDLMNITEEKVTDFIIKAREDGVKLGTINGWVKQINRWCRFRGQGIHLDRFRTRGVSDIQYIPDDIVMGMLNYEWQRYDQNLRNRAILWTTFSTGMRVSELVSLNWADIDEERKLITIRHGKGNKSRMVPVPERVIDTLNEYRKVRIKSDPRAVFTTQHGRINKVTVRRIFKEVGDALGFTRMHPHLARHWRAKNLLRQGVPINTVQKILGHANIKTTSIYLEASLDEVVIDIEEKDRFFSRGETKSKRRKGAGHGRNT